MKMHELATERRCQLSIGLDQLSPLQVVSLMNQQDKQIAHKIESQLPCIAEVIEQVVIRYRKGGRLIYIGAGTSGRLGVMDAAECVPTFGVSPHRVVALLAGGNEAMIRSIEKSEDNEKSAICDLQFIQLQESDSLIGIAASGSTPYVRRGLQYAKQTGALTIALTANSNSEIGKIADYRIEVETGPEVIAGSTRLKAATAHKMILNMISTVLMIRLGKVYDNLMVDLHVTNNKLHHRAVQMVISLTGLTEPHAKALLHSANCEVKVAVVMHYKQIPSTEATKLLSKHDGMLRKALSEDGGSVDG